MNLALVKENVCHLSHRRVNKLDKSDIGSVHNVFARQGIGQTRIGSELVEIERFSNDLLVRHAFFWA